MINAETQRRAEEAEQLKHNQTWAQIIEDMMADAMEAWTGEEDADKREALWRDVQAIKRLAENIEARIERLSMEARKAERKK